MKLGKSMNKCILLLTFVLTPALLSASDRYKIQAELEPTRRTVKGHIEMQFHNTSQDTLSELQIHLWPNAYSGHQTPWAKQMIKLNRLDFHYGKSYGYIDSLNFTQQGNYLTLVTSESQPDIGLILLNNPVLPGDSVTVQTPFRVKLPKMYSRGGYEGSYYAVTQWYPKFAVYQDGTWQSVSYLDQGEFFSGFADYDVSITVPSAYQFAATGYIYAPKDTIPEKQQYSIQLNNVHDFAWFASRKFTVKKQRVILKSGREVQVQAFVHSEKHLDKILEYASDALVYMSDYLGEYPYSVCSVVEGMGDAGGGMEYPTISTVSGGMTLRQQVVHEVIHNWWYGILANNERKEPILDEGLTSYYENRIIREKGGGVLQLNENSPKFKKIQKLQKYFGFNRQPKDFLSKTATLMQYRANVHQASNLPAEEFSMLNYYAMIYAKGALDFENLEKYLGRNEFDRLMQLFFEEYKFRHYSLKDFKNHFISHSPKSVEWFFDGVLSSTALSDLAVKKISRNDSLLQITLVNKGSLQAASELALVDRNLNILESVMIEPFTGKIQTEIEIKPETHAVYADPQWLLPERNRKSNFATLKGAQRFNPLQIRAIAALEDPTKNQLFITPLLAGNKYDGFMLGAAIYNRVFPAKKLEYTFVPFWGFRSKKLNWIGNMSYHILPKKQRPVDIEIGVHTKSFSKNNVPVLLRYIKFQPFIEATFYNLSNDRGMVHKLGFRNVQIWEENSFLKENDTINQIRIFGREKVAHNTSELWYSMENNHVLYPTALSSVLRFNKDYVRQAFEFNQKFRYRKNGAFFSMRLFAGAFYYRNSNYNFRLFPAPGFNISGVNGKNDYLYDGAFFGRNIQEGLSSRQMMMSEGNFKVITAIQRPNEGKTINGLFALNLKMDAPVKWLPVQIFFDMGYSIDRHLNTIELLPAKQFHYDFGFNISLFDEGVEVYFPLLMSDNFKTYYKSNLPKFGQRITFSIQTEKLNFHRQARRNLVKKMF